MDTTATGRDLIMIFMQSFILHYISAEAWGTRHEELHGVWLRRLDELASEKGLDSSKRETFDFCKKETKKFFEAVYDDPASTNEMREDAREVLDVVLNQMRCPLEWRR